jgi:4-hydroxy 2-oxovalerate aldolase
MSIKILDCTLRDGGYYGDWDFNRSTVNRYLAAISMAKIDIVEIGFRFLPQRKFLGPFAYSTDDYLNTLPLPDNITIAVMINASELINYKAGIDKAIETLFSEKSSSPVDIVRIATHVGDIEQCYFIAKALQELGYRVFLNLMQISSLDLKDISDIAQQIENWNYIEALYFADSFGNMNPESVATTVTTITTKWSGALGIHTHDNKGQALANSINAIEYGVTYIDSTLLGMGRGAGNAKTETLLVELVDRDLGEYYPDALFPLILQDFHLLHNQYNWGPNIYYFLSAVHGIHPTYIQEMLGDGRYDTEQILSAISFLKKTGAPFYSLESMLRAISGITGDECGDWSAKGWAKDKNVLIVGSGPSTKHYIDDLTRYIKKEKPIVLCLNINESVPEELVTAYVACHETRILMESDRYSGLMKPLVLPLSRIPKEMKNILSGANILDYGLRIKEGEFQIFENGCVLDSSLALIYALSLASVSGAKNILLAGIDGYELSDPKQQKMIAALERYNELSNTIPVHAITPTTYPIEQRSFYESDL